MVAKKIIYHRDSEQFHWETIYTSDKEISIPYHAGRFHELFTGFEAQDEDKCYSDSLFNEDNLARIDLPLQKNELYYLELRKNKELCEIITEPETLPKDIFIGKHYNHYIYSFYNNTDFPNITIIARIKDMDKDAYSKLSGNKDDIAYRKYLLKKMLKVNSTIAEDSSSVNKEKSLMNIKELAEYLNVQKGTVYNWVYKNKVPHHKPSGKLLFKKNEIDEWIAKKKI
jgi:excisionase family DNA binding protein